MDNVDKLLRDLLKPTYVYRMASAPPGSSLRMQRSAATRRMNAKDEIRAAILEYIDNEYPEAQLDG